MPSRNALTLVATVRDRVHRFLVTRLREEGISGLLPAHGAILVELFGERERSMSQVARAIQRDKSTVTVLVNKLIALGHVAKRQSPSDHRVTLLRLTRRGERLRPAFRRVSAQLVKAAFRGLSEPELGLLAELLGRVVGNLASAFDAAGTGRPQRGSA